MKGKRSPGQSLYDKLLVPRIENYGANNDITDTDGVCEYLRKAYKEYARHKLPAFRQQVERAVEAIARKGGITKAELRLQVGQVAGGVGGARESRGEGSSRDHWWHGRTFSLRTGAAILLCSLPAYIAPFHTHTHAHTHCAAGRGAPARQ